MQKYSIFTNRANKFCLFTLSELKTSPYNTISLNHPRSLGPKVRSFPSKLAYS